MIDNNIVDQICWSLENEPEKWVFKCHHFKKKGTNTEYWSTVYQPRITQIWTGYKLITVFNETQGERIYNSYQKALKMTATENQKKVISDWSKPERPPTVETIYASEGLFSRVINWFK